MVVDANNEPRLARRIGVRIKAARVASGLGADRVARSAGLTRRELSSYEAGRMLPSRGDLIALAGACGLQLDELVPRTLVESLP
jgi:transcriptional regulator with XRE-family HTH domain